MKDKEKIILLFLIVMLIVGIIAFFIFNTARNNGILLKDNIEYVDKK